MAISSLPKSRAGLITFWTVLFFAAFTIRVLLGDLGEFICTGLLVTGTTIAYAYTWWWKEPSSSSSSSSSSAGEHEQHPDIAIDIDIDRDEAIELQQSSHRISGTISGESITTDADTTETAIDTEAAGEAAPTTTTATAIANTRLPFLDNIKIFLTASVVTHHVACAFGCCGEGAWYFVVGFDGPRAFHRFVKGLTLFNQSYFMSLFFFISAYFVPSSYERGNSNWQSFAGNKRKRLLIPALFEFWVISPLTMVLSGEDYFPNPGVCWFLFWLLLFQMVYASFRSIEENRCSSTTTREHNYSLITNEGLQFAEEGAANETADVDLDANADADANAVAVTETGFTTTGPTIATSTRLRVACGAGICGLALVPFLSLPLGTFHTFASMPLATGSLLCDFFMFHLGLQAKKLRWFDKPLAEQLDIHPLVLALMVVLEFLSMLSISLTMNLEVWGALLLVIAGMFCLDMSLLVLLVFQKWCNSETSLTRYLARGAYGVYLTHPLVVVPTTMLYAKMFDSSESNEYYYPLGFVLVTLVSNLINWPLAHFLAQLPYLQKIL